MLNGIEVQGLGPVGVTITGVQLREERDGAKYVIGSLTGYPYSSATNWDGSGSSYKIILHCTSDLSQALAEG